MSTAQKTPPATNCLTACDIVVGGSILSADESLKLARLEGVIERGLQTFFEVGCALAEIRTGKLYRQTHGSFEEYCTQRWDISRPRAYQLLGAAETIQQIKMSTIVDIPSNEAQARPLTVLPIEQRAAAWERAVLSAPDGRLTAAHVTSVVRDFLGDDADELLPIEDDDETTRPRKMAVHYSSDTPEWYTPPEIVARAVKVLGRISLDPCSNAGTPTIPAAKHFTREEDGLLREWGGTVYMNPPYGKPIIEWVKRLAEHHADGRVNQAIALLPARTDTEWFRILRAFPRCFIWGRLRFVGCDNSAPFPSVAVYLGPNVGKFIKVFGEIGDIYGLVE